MTIRSRAWCGVLALSLLAPLAAAAQTPRNPFADLFGRAPERTGREFTAVQFRSTAGVQMGNTLEDGFQTTDSVIPDGVSGSVDGALTLRYMRDRVQVAGQARYAYQEYRKEPAFGVPSMDVDMRADFRPTTRLAFHGAASFARSPFFQLMFLTADQAGSMAPRDRQAIVLMRNDTVGGSAGVTSHYSKRSSIELSGSFRETNFALQPQHSFTAIGGRAQWRRQMARDLAVHAGYGRDQLRQSDAAGDLLFTNELLDIGIDYSKSLSLLRRTSFSFGTDTSMLRDTERGKHFRLNGNARLESRFLRTWIAMLSARRGTDFLPGFRSPVLTDQASGTLAGFLASRVILNANGSAGRGQVGFTDPRQFISYSGDAKLTFPVTRHLGVFTQYVYYRYQNPPEPETLFLLPRVARQAFSIGLETWISIYDKDKVTRDPR